MKKGFTLVELLVTIAILIAVIAFFTQALNYYSPDDEYIDVWFIAPEIQNMRSQRKIADELQRQNDLRERELELLEQSREN